MTIKDLKDILNDYGDDDIILMKPANSIYVEEIAGAIGRNVNSFWSDDDYNAVILTSDGQAGSV